jgi:hypothetical protein
VHCMYADINLEFITSPFFLDDSELCLDVRPLAHW